MSENDSPQMAPALPVATLLRVSMQALAVRVTKWVALGMSFGLFVAATWWPDTKRIITAALFTALVFIPVWWKKDR